MGLGLEKNVIKSVTPYNMLLGSVKIIVLGNCNQKFHLTNLKQTKGYCAKIIKRQNNAIFDYIPN